MQNDYLKYKFIKPNKQINNFMQQNVQSERLLENFNYSQERNSIPSKFLHSQKNPQHNQVTHNQLKLRNLPNHNSNSTPSENKIKLIDQEIQNQIQLISILQKQNQLQKQQLQNTLNKSFLSLNHQELINLITDDNLPHQDELLETKTQADHSFLEGRKNQAIKELQNEEQKYKENIRKIQLKKTQMRRKLKDEQEIPIKIMDFKDLEKKKQGKQDEPINLQNHPQMAQQQQSEKIIQKSVAEMTKKSSEPLLIESQQINECIPLQSQTLQKRGDNQIIQASSVKSLKQNAQSLLKQQVQSIKSKQPSLKERQISIKEKQRSEKISQISDRKSHDKNSQNQRLTNKSNQKKYSVKLSSVIVPESNDSIKQIQERKSLKRYQNQVSAKRSSISSHSQKDLQEIQKEDFSVKSKISSEKKSVDNSAKSSKKEEKIQQNQLQNVQSQGRSLRKSENEQNVCFKEEVNSQRSKPKSILSPQFTPQEVIETKLNLSVKEKTASVKSRTSNKKQERTQFLYIPHGPKQPSHKSFKKTDKSIQWSEVDISMYGRTNQIVDQSRLCSRINNQHSQSIPQNTKVNEFIGVEVNRINMKKNKLINENNFFEMSEKQMKSEKSVNLVPLIVNQQKSQKSSHTNSHHSSKGSFIASREGSVKQKVDRYDRFQRDHSLKSEKVENKLCMIESLNNKIANNNKPVSYRSRKSNSKQGSSISKSRVSSVSKGNQNIQQEKEKSVKQISPLKQQSKISVKETSVFVSKEQVSLLHEHIRKLEQKICHIEEKQQKLAKQKTQEILKLQQLMLQQGKEEEELKKSILTQKSQESLKQQIVIIRDENKSNRQNSAQNQQLIPQIESVSKQLDPPDQYEVIEEKQPTISDHNQDTAQPNIELFAIQDPNKERLVVIQGSSEQEDKFQHSNKVQQTHQELFQLPKQPQALTNKLQTDLQKSRFSQRNTIQHQINHIAQTEAKFSQEKSQLMDQITRLKKIIREMQIQKIKAIQQNRTLIFNDTKSQKPDHKIIDEGIIPSQNKKNRTLEPLKLDSKHSELDEGQKSPFGKIVKNSPGKNVSRLTNVFQRSQQSPDKKFRINTSKKSSALSESIVKNNIESNDFISLPQNSAIVDEEGNDLLLKKKSQSYPINQKQGYIVLANQNQVVSNLEKQPQTNLQQQKKQGSKELQCNDINISKKSEQAKQEVLQRFNRTNREFNNFVESSRLINETNSSLSSQNNLFDKTNRSASFVNNTDNKSLHNSEDDNPENKILNKVSSSRLDLQIASNENQHFQQSFTRIVNEIKNEQHKDESEEQNEIPQISIGSLEIVQLSKTPDISYDQDQLMDLAKQTFKMFDIEVHNDDTDFNMKKYKNCVIFTKGSETILWHYNGKFYIGGWKGKQDGSGEKTGFGVQIVPDKHIYKGQFMNGKKHGTGIMKLTNGNIYDGQWIDGIKSGQGTYYDATTKVIYQGEWKDGKKNGYGVLKFSAKQYYKGTFVKSVKEGYGTEVFVNGDQYRGEYRKGKFHGKGKYSWVNTSVFEGDFNQGMRHGHGTWRSSKVNPDIYVGSYENDKKSGYGRYVWSNGCIYEGNFAQDVKHGKGRLIYTDGRQIKGIWEEGSLLEAVTQHSKQYQQQDALKRSGKFRIK